MSEQKGKTEQEIQKELDNASKPNAETAKDALKQLADDKHAANVKKTKEAMEVSEFEQKVAYAKLVKTRAAEKAEKALLTAMSELNKEFSEGGVDVKEHKKKMQKLREECFEAGEKAEDEYRISIANAKTLHPSGHAMSEYRWSL